MEIVDEDTVKLFLLKEMKLLIDRETVLDKEHIECIVDSGRKQLFFKRGC